VSVSRAAIGMREEDVNTAAQLKTNIHKLFDEANAEWEGVFPRVSASS